jgi:hypothetical protein
LQPSQKTMALLFSPSESSHTEHVESSEGRPKSDLGRFFVYKGNVLSMTLAGTRSN